MLSQLSNIFSIILKLSYLVFITEEKEGCTMSNINIFELVKTVVEKDLPAKSMSLFKKVYNRLTGKTSLRDYPVEAQVMFNKLFTELYPKEFGNTTDSVKKILDLMNIHKEFETGIKIKELFSRISSEAIENADVDNMDEDWIENYWDKASRISDEEFKIIWDKIFEHEIQHPKSISKRLLHAVYTMDSDDAKSFVNVAQLCFCEYRTTENMQPLIYIKEAEATYKEFGITTDSLNNLHILGLIEIDYTAGYTYYGKMDLLFKGRYYFLKGEKIPVGNVKLTKEGQTLFRLINLEINDDKRMRGIVIRMLLLKKCQVTMMYYVGGRERVTEFTPDMYFDESWLDKVG